MDVLNGIAEITAEAEEITHDDTKDKDLVSISFILNNRNIFLIRKYVIGISWTNGISFPRWQWTSRSRRILSVCILFLLNNTIYNPSINLPVCDTVCPSFGNQKCQPVNLYYISIWVHPGAQDCELFFVQSRYAPRENSNFEKHDKTNKNRKNEQNAWLPYLSK